MKTQKKTYLFALAPFLLLCLLFEIIPVIYTVVRSFFPEGGEIGFTLDNYINIFTGKLYQQAIINSLLISVLSSVIGRGIYRRESRTRGKRKTETGVYEHPEHGIEFLRRAAGICIHHHVRKHRRHDNDRRKLRDRISGGVPAVLGVGAAPDLCIFPDTAVNAAPDPCI